MPKSPHEWSSEEKLEALLESAKLSEEELGKYLRRRGLHAAQLEEWRAQAREGLTPSKSRSVSRRIQKLEKEITRKDKALAEAAALLPPEPWDQETFRVWTSAVKSATGRGGKALFRPLRLALTGREQGPELKALLPLIGRAATLERLGR